MMWLTLLTNKWTWIILIFVGFLATIGIQRVALQHKSSQIEERDKTIATQKAAVAERDALITTQNGYVEAWKAAAVKQASLKDAAEKKAAEAVAAIRALPLPIAPPTHIDCLERDSWLRSELNDLLWR